MNIPIIIIRTRLLSGGILIANWMIPNEIIVEKIMPFHHRNEKMLIIEGIPTDG